MMFNKKNTESIKLLLRILFPVGVLLLLFIFLFFFTFAMDLLSDA